MSYCAVESGKSIIEEKTLGTCFYFLKHGTIACTLNNKSISELKAPAYFGERALLNDLQRVNGYKSIETCYLYVLDKDKFLKIFNQAKKELGLEERKEVLENNPILSNYI